MISLEEVNNLAIKINSSNYIDGQKIWWFGLRVTLAELVVHEHLYIKFGSLESNHRPAKFNFLPNFQLYGISAQVARIWQLETSNTDVVYTSVNMYCVICVSLQTKLEMEKLTLMKNSDIKI